MARIRLIIITGPSHSGKSLLATSLTTMLGRPTATIGIDELVATLNLAPPDSWGEHWRLGLPVAYDVASAHAEVLLRHGITVLLESTFTYISLDGGRGECHADRLDGFVQIGVQAGAEVRVVRLTADREELLRRRAATMRLSDLVVEGTWATHNACASDASSSFIEIDTTRRDAAAVADEVAAALASV